MTIYFKPLKNVVLDLDDFSVNPANNCLNQLLWLKDQYPKLKVTLFAIPFHLNYDNGNFLRMVKKAFTDWIEFGIHGWTHGEGECLKWNEKEAKEITLVNFRRIRAGLRFFTTISPKMRW